MQLSIYDFKDYREFLEDWITQKGHRGLRGKMAVSMRISSTMMSLIMKGEKHLSLEHAADLVDFIGLSEHESEYFFLLVEIGRAGSETLKQKLSKRRHHLQVQAQKISRRVRKDLDLDDRTKAIFYSSWLYSGLSVLSSIPKLDDVSTIALKTNLPIGVVSKVIEFLLDKNLCTLKDGKLQHGPQSTHLDAESPYVNKHHQNWRLKGMNSMEGKLPSDLFFTSPMSLSEDLAKEIRNHLPTVIEQIMKKIGPSPSEKAYCLNIDWFGF